MVYCVYRIGLPQKGEEMASQEKYTILYARLSQEDLQKKNGKEAIIRFSKWTLTHELVGETVVGDASFAAYIKSRYQQQD